MAGTRKLTIEVLGDAKGLSKTFDDAEKKADGFGSKIGKIGGLAAAGVAGIGVAAIALAPDILETGGKLEALGKKAATVFEGSLGDVKTWAAGNAKAMGLTNKEAVGAAAGIADLLKPMGFSAKAAAGMSTKMLDLSGALSAWSGGTKSAAEVSDIITKAMLGETDGLKGLGISISAADVSQRLMDKGQSDLTGSALEQAQALATQELIMEKSTDAQKAWTDGSMDNLKAQNEQKAGMDTLKETLVTSLYPALQALIPILTTVAEWLGTNLPIAIEKVRIWFEENWPKIRDAVVPVLQGIQDFIVGFISFIQGAWDVFGQTIVQFARDYFGSVVKVIQGVFEVISGIFQLFKDIFTGKWGELWGDIVGIVTGVKDIVVGAVAGIWSEITLAAGLAWDGIKGIVTGAWDAILKFITGLPAKIASAAVGMWDGIKNAFKSMINAIIGFWNGLEFTFPGYDIPGPGPNIPGFTLGLPDIPKFHGGGVAQFRGAGEGLAWLRNDEVVFTPEQMEALSPTAGGVTMINHFDGITDHQAIATAQAREFGWRLRAG